NIDECPRVLPLEESPVARTLLGTLGSHPLVISPAQDIILKTMLTRIGGSRILWVIRSSSLTDSTVSSATSRPKRHCDLPHEDDHSDGPPPRSRV
ncbi:hypothetical protein PIB30_094443, partial [Stylosanthes scabra]|nr:hypothetical protein [Stylosanthes scabra]